MTYRPEEDFVVQFQVSGCRYEAEIDRTDENKIEHRIITSAGETLSVDFDPYTPMRREDVELWLAIGRPERKVFTGVNYPLHRTMFDGLRAEFREISQPPSPEVLALILARRQVR